MAEKYPNVTVSHYRVQFKTRIHKMLNRLGEMRMLNYWQACNDMRTFILL